MTDQDWNPESSRCHVGSICPFSMGIYKGRQCRLINSLPPHKMMLFCRTHFKNCAEYKKLTMSAPQCNDGRKAVNSYPT